MYDDYDDMDLYSAPYINWFRIKYAIRSFLANVKFKWKKKRSRSTGMLFDELQFVIPDWIPAMIERYGNQSYANNLDPILFADTWNGAQKQYGIYWIDKYGKMKTLGDSHCDIEVEDPTDLI